MIKKLVAGVCLSTLMIASVFAAEGTFSFSNTLSSDVVSISGGSAEFAGVFNETEVDFLTDKFDAGITTLSFLGNDGMDNFAFGFSNFGLGIEDWYIEFRPFSVLTLGLNDAVYTPGSYLPVADDNAANGNIGSSFVVVYRPFEGIRISAGLGAYTIFEEGHKPEVNFGLDYQNAAFAAGVSFRNVADNFGFGIFGSLTAVENLVINAGYSYNDDGELPVEGNILLAGVTYENDAFSLAFDFASNFAKDDAENLYAGASFAYQISDLFAASLTSTFVTGFASDAEKVFTIEPDAIFTFGNNEMGLGINFEISDSLSVSFPIYWNYSL